MQHHKYSLTELDNLMPWERQVYIDLLLKHLDEEAERVKEERRKTGKEKQWQNHQLHRQVQIVTQ
jgi:hypothetical protein